MRYALSLVLITGVPVVAQAQEPAPAKRIAPDSLTTADWLSVAKQFTELGNTARADLAWCRVLTAEPDHALARTELRFERGADKRWTPRAVPRDAAKRQPTTLARLRRAYDAAQTTAGRTAVLARIGECRSARAGVALAYAATHDRDKVLRASAFAALRGHGLEETAYALHTQLRAKSSKARVRTVEAMATLKGSRLAPRLLAANWTNALGRGPRVNITIGVIKAYISDFEVEVASFAAIGDPHVQVIREGVKLDHQVLTGTSIVSARIARASRRALKSLVGRDLGADPRRWSAHLNSLHADTESSSKGAK